MYTPPPEMLDIGTAPSTPLGRPQLTPISSPDRFIPNRTSTSTEVEVARYYLLADTTGAPMAPSAATSPQTGPRHSLQAPSSTAPPSPAGATPGTPQHQNHRQAHASTPPSGTPPASAVSPGGLLMSGLSTDGVSVVTEEPYACNLARSLFAETSQYHSVLSLGGGGTRTSWSNENRGRGSDTVRLSTLSDYDATLDESLDTTADTLNSTVTSVGPVSMRAPLLPARMSASDEMQSFNRSMGVVYNENKQRNFQSRSFRVIPQTPERILDAPELLDDFYLNLIDWSNRNALSVALGQMVYLWNADNGEINQLLSNDDAENIITSVSWDHEGTQLAVGTNNHAVQLWDAHTKKKVREITGHTGRVGSLSWNSHLLASGSRDSSIRLTDIRCRTPAAVLRGHHQEVCGLRWSPTGLQLASGGNDNVLNIWDVNRHYDNASDRAPCMPIRAHSAAVKAIAWNPAQPSLLVSGGGTADKTLRFWNTQTGSCLHSIDTKSQVCGVLWNHSGTELISSHGYSDNQLTLWRYPSLKRITDLTGHSSRVLHLAMSPDGQMVVSAAGDETIRFWRCFAPSGSTRQGRRSGRSSGTGPMDHATAMDPAHSAYGGDNPFVSGSSPVSEGRPSLRLR